MDSADNTVIAGDYSSCYHCNNLNGVFITKILSDGTVAWTDTISAPYINITQMYFKNNGSTIIAGVMWDTINFLGHQLIGAQYETGYYAEFDASGNCLGADTLPYIPICIIRNNDNSLSIAGITTHSITNLNYYPSSGNFIGNFSDFNTANWIQDLQWTFTPYAKLPMVAIPNNTIYLLMSSQLRKYTALGSTYSNASNGKLHYMDGKLFGLYGSYWSGNEINVYDTAGVIISNNVFGNECTIQALCFHNQNYIVSGVFKDSLIFNGQNYYTDQTGLGYMFLMETDSNWKFLSLKLVKQIENYTYGGVWADFITSNNNDIFIQGPILVDAIFGTDTIAGACCDYKNYYFAKIGSNSVGLEEAQMALDELILYPNPTKGIINISGNSREELTWKILNTQGQVILTETPNQSSTSIDLKHLAAGIYFVEIHAKNHINIKKVIIN